MAKSASARRRKRDTGGIIRPPIVPFTVPSAPPPPRMVTIYVKLVPRAWEYLDDTLTLPLSAPLLEVRQHIEARHGGSAVNIQLYSGEPTTSTLLPDHTRSLAESGVIHGEKHQTSVATVYYTFSSPPENAVLMCLPPPEISSRPWSARFHTRRGLEG
eukprot:TRINITY_DN15929_c0_g1_i1.p2 TRINITY_DN15929_c0_g1~~TRINITY_DN15929_c0_g1_i1.p2  ORF type:complete len:158 (-),score=29.94 TRINITY_DN15929_c0_g1_i1:99-572(-)